MVRNRICHTIKYIRWHFFKLIVDAYSLFHKCFAFHFKWKCIKSCRTPWINEMNRHNFPHIYQFNAHERCVISDIRLHICCAFWDTRTFICDALFSMRMQSLFTLIASECHYRWAFLLNGYSTLNIIIILIIGYLKAFICSLVYTATDWLCNIVKASAHRQTKLCNFKQICNKHLITNA